MDINGSGSYSFRDYFFSQLLKNNIQNQISALRKEKKTVI